MQFLIGILSGLSAIGILTALFKIFQKPNKPVINTTEREKEINFEAAKKIEQLRSQIDEPMDKKQILDELNRYRNTN
jgi:ABC-type bacteriocin/lantibiotic exporter with double-glycine peptidase domain